MDRIITRCLPVTSFAFTVLLLVVPLVNRIFLTALSTFAVPAPGVCHVEAEASCAFVGSTFDVDLLSWRGVEVAEKEGEELRALEDAAPGEDSM